MILEGDCVEAMAAMDEASVDAIVTDPPYNLGFMSRPWDIQHDHEPWSRQALRILKPGGHLLAFGGTRTYHRLACAVEDAGFEIRDSLIWIYGSGFPKSLDVSKAIDKAAGAEREVVGEKVVAVDQWTEAGRQAHAKDGDSYAVPLTAPATPEARKWQGWGTALKPAHEPIVVARKPLAGTVAANVLEHGTGALNVDGCRVGTGEGKTPAPTKRGESQPWFTTADEDNLGGDDAAGRWPANVTLSHLPECERVGTRRVKGSAPASGPTLSATESVAHGDYNGARGDVPAYQDQEIPSYNCAPGCPLAELDRQSGERPGSPLEWKRGKADQFQGVYTEARGQEQMFGYGDTGGASRFFYCAKASRGERNAGLDGFEEGHPQERGGPSKHFEKAGSLSLPRANVHPTVKPIDLMRWLVRLVTPPGGTVLDPFTGSGTTGAAAILEGVDFIGCELDPEYAEIARARIEWWSQFPPGTTIEAALGIEVVDRVHRESGQMGLFAG